MMTSEPDSSGRFAVVIPVYNHGGTVNAVVQAALELSLPVFVVDDGSTDESGRAVQDIAGAQLLRHPSNQGKGAALMTGFQAAAKVADWAITIDADGQHYPGDAVSLIRALPGGQRAVVLGCRQHMLSKGAPWTSRFGRGFSNFWVRSAGGPTVADSQSGFRIYPLPEVLHLGVRARRYQFEVEVLVRAAWARLPVVEAPIRVTYGAKGERISHFRPFVDFCRNSGTFSRLILQRIFLNPFLRSTN